MVVRCISMCDNMHGDTAPVPLYLHAVLSQRNTLHSAAAFTYHKVHCTLMFFL